MGEYAARAGSEAVRYGDLNAIAWYGWSKGNSAGKTHDVGLKQPNEWMLYDMLGNVGEWVEDRFDENYYTKSPSSDPKGPLSGEYRVVRGGSWFNGSRYLRSSDRYWLEPDSRDFDVGFRCVREVFP